MAVDWSDNIVIANLADEPALSDELSMICERIENAKEQEPVPNAVLEFHEVSYVNSSNIAQLLRLRKNLEAHNRQLVLSGVSDEVMSVLVVTGLNKVFKFAADLLTAIASIQISEPDQN
ncbi:MAG: STAS domain-containing protein [Phycisphaerales bacterium]|jgi:anti-anti-sigma factor|nr:STAS domain-containing protein [Phycisphaerales bacterium]